MDPDSDPNADPAIFIIDPRKMPTTNYFFKSIPAVTYLKIKSKKEVTKQ
jgi:hypothetical protein